MNKILASMAAIVLFFCLVDLTGADDKPQSKEPEPHKISVKTELMEVRAVVTDRSGKIVEGLKKEDFELLENDRSQEISFFSISEVKSPAPAAVVEKQRESNPSPPEPAKTETSSVAAQLRTPPARSTLFFVDTMNMSFPSLVRAREAIRRYVREKLTDQDMVAIAATGQSLGFAQTFTKNKQLIDRAIEQLRLARTPIGGLFTPSVAAGVVEERIEETQIGIDILRQETFGAQSTGTPNTSISPSQIMADAMAGKSMAPLEKPSRNPIDCCMLRVMALARARQVLTEAAYSRKNALFMLEQYAKQMVELPGKRMVVVFSDGFSLFDVDGFNHTEDLTSSISRAVRSTVVINAIDSRGLAAPSTIDAERRYGSQAESDPGVTASPDQIDTSNGSCPNEKNDPRCKPPTMGIFERFINKDEREALNGLSAMAQQTGGKLYTDTNDLFHSLGDAIDANRYYYVLSYYLSPGDDRRFRTIKAQVKNHPEYKISIPRGFIPADIKAKEEDIAAMTPQKQLLKAMSAPLPKADIGVSAQADYFEIDKDDKQVSLTVSIDGDTLQYHEKDGNKAVQLDIIFAIYDSNGKQADAASVQAEGKLDEAGMEQAKKSGYRFSRRASLKPGLYEVRIGVREPDTNRIGTAITWIEVPATNQKQLGVSSLLLSNPLESDQDVTEGMKLSKLEQIKMVQNIPLYKRDDYCDYSFRLRRGDQMDKNIDVAWMSELVRDGKTIKQESWKSIAEDAEKDSKGWFDLDGEVDLKGFEPGIYELRVSVKEGNSKKLVQRDVVFGIE